MKLRKCSKILLTSLAVYSSLSFAVTLGEISDIGAPHESTQYIYLNNLTGHSIKLYKQHGYQINYNQCTPDSKGNKWPGSFDKEQQAFLVTAGNNVSVTHGDVLGITYTYQSDERKMSDDGADVFYEIEPGYRFHLHFWSGTPADGAEIAGFVDNLILGFAQGMFPDPDNPQASGESPSNIVGDLLGLGAQSVSGNIRVTDNHAYLDLDASSIGDYQQPVNQVFSSQNERIDEIGNKYVVFIYALSQGWDIAFDHPGYATELNHSLPSRYDGSAILTIMTTGAYNNLRNQFDSADPNDLSKLVNTMDSAGIPVTTIDDLKNLVLPMLPIAPGGDTPLPQGSYQKTCQNIKYDSTNGVLTSSCEQTNGNYINATLNFNAQCNSYEDIENTNGVLACKNFGDFNPPPGSYLKTCTGVSMDNNGNVSASCQDQNNNYKKSVLYYGSCPINDGITNSNGNLVCS